MKKFHILYLIEGCSPKLRKFKTIKALKAFVEGFEKKHKGHDDYWIDYAVTNVTGEILIYDESVDYKAL